MARRRKSNEDLILLALMGLVVWIASRVKGRFRLIVTLLLIAGAALALTTTKRWMAGFAVIGVVFMWREKLPQGLYLRRAVSVGPLRVNVSTSGLGGSIGVTGARIGLRPDGSKYLHAGRGGVYYRKELLRAKDTRQSHGEVDSPMPPAATYSSPQPPSTSGSAELQSGGASADSDTESSEAIFYCDRCSETYQWEVLAEVRECVRCDHRFDARALGRPCPTCGDEDTQKVTDLACPDCLEETDH
jgi:hypothetical protein